MEPSHMKRIWFEAVMGFLRCHGTTSAKQVTSALHLVKNELDLRDRCRAEIRERLKGRCQPQQ